VKAPEIVKTIDTSIYEKTFDGVDAELIQKALKTRDKLKKEGKYNLEKPMALKLEPI